MKPKILTSSQEITLLSIKTGKNLSFSVWLEFGWSWVANVPGSQRGTGWGVGGWLLEAQGSNILLRKRKGRDVDKSRPFTFQW